jgi:gas vesicle protein
MLRWLFWGFDMSENSGNKVSYFLVGMGIGALLGILFAPKSGDETRELLTRRADEGKDFAQRKARELRERADELVERGRDAVDSRREEITDAIEAGKQAYRTAKSKN